MSLAKISRASSSSDLRISSSDSSSMCRTDCACRCAWPGRWCRRSRGRRGASGRDRSSCLRGCRRSRRCLFCGLRRGFHRAGRAASPRRARRAWARRERLRGAEPGWAWAAGLAGLVAGRRPASKGPAGWSAALVQREALPAFEQNSRSPRGWQRQRHETGSVYARAPQVCVAANSTPSVTRCVRATLR